MGRSTITKLGKGANVEMDALVKICCAVNCEISDVVEIVKTEETL
ncbi:MAG: hypothetical protein E7435_00650 [Ruminococcaceae bacterium]|nr:hypothetical protein [Oscillospiraceae bacterium]